MEQLLVSLPSSGPPLEYRFDALYLSAGSSIGLNDGEWASFHLLHAHRQNQRSASSLTVSGESSFDDVSTQAQFSLAIGDDPRCLANRHWVGGDASLKLDRPGGLPYAALYQGSRRLCSLTPGGVWFADAGVLEGEHGPARGRRLYLLGPGYDALTTVPLGPRGRLSALSI